MVYYVMSNNVQYLMGGHLYLAWAAIGTNTVTIVKLTP